MPCYNCGYPGHHAGNCPEVPVGRGRGRGHNDYTSGYGGGYGLNQGLGYQQAYNAGRGFQGPGRGGYQAFRGRGSGGNQRAPKIFTYVYLCLTMFYQRTNSCRDRTPSPDRAQSGALMDRPSPKDNPEAFTPTQQCHGSIEIGKFDWGEVLPLDLCALPAL